MDQNTEENQRRTDENQQRRRKSEEELIQEKKSQEWNSDTMSNSERGYMKPSHYDQARKKTG